MSSPRQFFARRRAGSARASWWNSIDLVTGAAISVLLLLALCVAFPALVAPYDPQSQDISSRLVPPFWNDGGSLAHPLGTDQLGRDVLSRLVYGARTTIGIAIAAATLEAIIGVTIGVVAGYFGGRIDRALRVLIDLQMGFPAILLLMVIILSFGNSIPLIILALGLNGWMIFARITRSRVLTLRNQTFVEAAVASGAGNRHIVRRHILPHIRVDVLTLMVLEIARIVLAESGLSFLGIGVQPPTISWGLVLGEGRDYVPVAYHLALFAGVAISVLVLSLNAFATWLAPVLDPTRDSTRSTRFRTRLLRESVAKGAAAPAPGPPVP